MLPRLDPKEKVLVAAPVGSVGPGRRTNETR
jgi:hypothetical protein